MPIVPAVPAACEGGSTACGGACVRLATDNAHCGTCGNACAPGEVCSNGTCAVTCAATLATCGAGAATACKDLKNDPANCGACGNACPSGQLCGAGECVATASAVCTAPHALCGSGAEAVCLDLDNDPANCGACGKACASGQVCSAGACADTCTGAAGTICDGRCVNLSSDDLHCGSCTTACGPGTSCSSGACAPTCPAGEVRCGDACVPLDRDPANCGACGNVCPASGVCAAGACVAVACPGRFGLSGEEDIVGARANAAFAADMDGDGLPDLVVADTDRPTFEILKNLGGRRFAAPAVYQTGFRIPGGLVVGDVNGDGRPDVVAFVDGAFSLWLGLPDGTVTGPIATGSTGSLRAAALGDLDGDGRADAVVATGAQIAVYLAQPSGGFGPAVIVPSSDPFVAPTSVALADLDGDGLLDVVAGALQGGAVTVSRNLGGGVFAVPVAYVVDPAVLLEDVATGDVDGDGRPDVVAVVTGTPLNGIAVLRNLGDGTLAAPALVETGFLPLSMALGDVDGNGSVDVALGNWGDVRRVDVLRNRGDGTFLPSEPYFDEGAQGLSFADVDLDGRRDLIVASRAGFGVHLLWNEGGGQFLQPPLVAAPITPDDLVLADVDGDGLQDVVAVDATAGKLAIFPGRGAGTFGAARLTDLAGSFVVRAGDLDGDGALDLVANSDAGIITLRNDGSGAFSAVQTLPGIGSQFALADLDGDGRLDLVVSSTSRIVFLPGLGDATFGAAVEVSNDFSDRLALADFDGDGKIDVLYSSFSDVRVVRNLAGGLFGAPVTIATNLSNPGSVAAGDLDGDGRPDVAVGDLLNGVVGILLNNGDGSFGRMQSVPLFDPDQLEIAAIPGQTRGVVVARGGLSQEVALIEVARDGTIAPMRRWATRGGLGRVPFATGDVDGDLRPDVVVGAVGGVAVLRSACLP